MGLFPRLCALEGEGIKGAQAASVGRKMAVSSPCPAPCLWLRRAHCSWRGEVARRGGHFPHQCPAMGWLMPRSPTTLSQLEQAAMFPSALCSGTAGAWDHGWPASCPEALIAMTSLTWGTPHTLPTGPAAPFKLRWGLLTLLSCEVLVVFSSSAMVVPAMSLFVCTLVCGLAAVASDLSSGCPSAPSSGEAVTTDGEAALWALPGQLAPQAEEDMEVPGLRQLCWQPSTPQGHPVCQGSRSMHNFDTRVLKSHLATGWLLPFALVFPLEEAICV